METLILAAAAIGAASALLAAGLTTHLGARRTRAAASADAPAPAPAPVRATSELDMDLLAADLCTSADPAQTLKDIVGDIRTREADATNPENYYPSTLELFLAQQLEEAGLFADDVSLGHLRVVTPRHSGLFYIRMEDKQVPYLTKLRVIQLESALNRTLFATIYFTNKNEPTLEEIYQLNQTLATSIDQQADIAPDEGAWGEWGVRAAIAEGIERFRVPWRLTAAYRVNLARHAVAFRVDVPPADVFPQRAWVASVGRVVPTTSTMRQHAAGDYALRLGLLLARYTLACSRQISEVWISGVLDTATTHSCLYSVCFERSFIEALPAHVDNLVEVYEQAGAAISPVGEQLQNVQPLFSLEDERFCPPERYEAPELSDRELDDVTAATLGTRFISGLSISEDARREKVAGEIARNMGTSTEDNVRAVLNATTYDPDITVRLAGQRIISELLEGSLEGSDPYEFERSFVAGDKLSRALKDAFALTNENRRHEALATIEPVLIEIDRAQTYADTDEISYHYFRSYVERTLYNRLFQLPGVFVALAPDAYYEAHLLTSALLLGTGKSERALVHARRCIALNPFDERAHLQTIQCLEALGNHDEARRQAKSMLECAITPAACGLGYYRLAYILASQGDFHTAEACYKCSLSFSSPVVPVAIMEMSALAASGQIQGTMDLVTAREVLAAEQIPEAPTSRVREALDECARAALDAEIFPVARSFGQVLASFSADDVLSDVIRSIEDEPDH